MIGRWQSSSCLSWYHSSVADRLSVAVRFSAGPRVRLRTCKVTGSDKKNRLIGRWHCGRPRPGGGKPQQPCSVDTAAITPTNVLIDTVWSKIERDRPRNVRLHVAENAGQHIQPTVEQPSWSEAAAKCGAHGAPPMGSRNQEQKQLKEANLLVGFRGRDPVGPGKWSWEALTTEKARWNMPNVLALRERDKWVTGEVTSTN